MSTEADIVERLPGPDKQLDRVFIGAGEYVRADEALALVTQLRADLATAMRKLSIAEDEAESYHKFWIEQRDEATKLRAERDAAARAERERCAKVAETFFTPNILEHVGTKRAIAAEIRSLPDSAVPSDLVIATVREGQS